MSAYEALASLRDHLATITEANGYPVTVAGVKIGAGALAGASDGPFPEIALLTLRDDPDTNTMPQSPRQQWTRVIGLEATIEAYDGWDEQLDLLWESIRKALTTFGSPPLRFSPAIFTPPTVGVNGSGALCSVRLELSFLYRTSW